MKYYKLINKSEYDFFLAVVMEDNTIKNILISSGESIGGLTMNTIVKFFKSYISWGWIVIEDDFFVDWKKEGF